MTTSRSDPPPRICQERLVATACRVAAKASDDARALDRDGAFPDDDVRRLDSVGLLLAPFALAKDPGPRHAIALHDVLVALGRGSLAVARLYEGHVNAVSLAVRYGTPANVTLLRREAEAGRLSAVWMAGDALRLVEEGRHRRLVGRKILCSGAGHVGRPLVAADTAAGSTMVIPRLDARHRVDCSSWTALGMRATATGDVDFADILVADNEIVGRPGDYLRSPYFRGGAWRVIAAQLGGLEAVLDQYKRQLVTSSHRDHPIQLARFGEAAIFCETARLWVRQACLVAEGDGAPDAIDAYVDLARNAFETAALEVVTRAEKAIGLKAFLRPNPLERLIRDLTTYLRQPALDASLLSGARHLLAYNKSE